MKKTLLLTTIAFASHAFAQTTNGLVSYYSFNDGTTIDNHGTNDATNANATPVTDMFNNDSAAYDFNGASGHINLGTDSTLKPTEGTVSLWAKLDAISNSGSGTTFNPLIMAKNTNSGSFFEAYAIYVRQSDAQIWAFCTNPATNSEKIITAGSLPYDDWAHLALSWDSDSMSLYVNGALINTINKGFTTVYAAAEPVRLGRLFGGSNDRYFNGKLDEVRIYNRVLTDNEIDELSKASNFQFNINKGNVSASSPICIDESANITVSNTQTNLNYLLMKNGNIVDGPKSGNGGAISLNSGNLSTNTSFDVYASFTNEIENDNGAIEFDGTNDLIEIPLDSNFRYDTAYTVEAWVYAPLPNNTNRWPSIFSISNTDSTDVEIYVQNSTNDFVVVHNRGSNSAIQGGHGFTDPPHNDWYHVAVSYDGISNTLVVYYNGEAQTLVQNVNPIVAPVRSDNAKINLGNINSNAFVWNSYLDGKLDNMRVWTTARTQEEIQNNMYKCLSGNENNLMYLFKFDQNNTSNLVDYGPQMHDGTLNNMDTTAVWVDGSFSCGAQLKSITINVENCDTTGIFENDVQNMVSVFPNPSVNFINIESKYEVISAELRSTTGQLVATTKNTSLNISSVEYGTYILLVNTVKGTYNVRVVKQ